MKANIIDARYSTIKILIESGHIKSIRDIFQFIPKTTVYKDFGINFNRFDRGINNPAIFRMEDLLNWLNCLMQTLRNLLIWLMNRF